MTIPADADKLEVVIPDKAIAPEDTPFIVLVMFPEALDKTFVLIIGTAVPATPFTVVDKLLADEVLETVVATDVKLNVPSPKTFKPEPTFIPPKVETVAGFSVMVLAVLVKPVEKVNADCLLLKIFQSEDDKNPLVVVLA